MRRFTKSESDFRFVQFFFHAPCIQEIRLRIKTLEIIENENAATNLAFKIDVSV